MNATNLLPFHKLHRDKALLLVVDLQEKLLPAIADSTPLLSAAGKLISGALALGLPVVATEQYPAGLGRTLPAIRDLLGTSPVFEKMLFSACIPAVSEALAGRNQVILTGIEAHVCVQQTVLDLLQAGKAVWVCADAVSSRKPFDRDTALDRMRQAGAVITTTESVLFELLGQAGTDDFKKILRIVK